MRAGSSARGGVLAAFMGGGGGRSEEQQCSAAPGVAPGGDEGRGNGEAGDGETGTDGGASNGEMTGAGGSSGGGGAGEGAGATDGQHLSSARNVVSEVGAATTGWVTLVKDGKKLVTSRVKLGPGSRRQYQGQWERRRANDKREAIKPGYLSQTRLSSELTSDPTGVGFGFGGVEPGVLHAKGQLVEVHGHGSDRAHAHPAAETVDSSQCYWAVPVH